MPGTFVLAAPLARAGPPAVGGAAAPLDCGTAPIHETHIFEGELNRRGRLVGFHHVGFHEDRIVRVLCGPNAPSSPFPLYEPSP